jgi:hypothetical protein
LLLCILALSRNFIAGVNPLATLVCYWNMLQGSMLCTVG